MNSLNDIEKYLDKTWKLLKDFEEHSADRPILKTNLPNEVTRVLSSEFPRTEHSFDNLLSEFKEQILPFLNLNTDARFGAYITGSGNRISALAEFIKGFFNQNGLKWNNSPITSELEQVVLRWVAEFVELPEFKKGVITSGGSMSNFLGIHFALADRYPKREMDGLFNGKMFIVYCSNQTHSSIDRAMVFLGLGRNQLRKIAVNERFEINIDKLEDAITADIARDREPLMIIGNAGTTNTGSIDNLQALAAIARKFGLWYHVDGAYGLPARRLPELADLFEGIDKADSVIINPHKWMYVTFEASCILLKKIPKAIHFSPDYLFTENPEARWESSEHTIELSKEFRALKIWFTMKYYGADQLTRFVKHDIKLTDELAVQLDQIPEIQVESQHPLSILCFRWNDTALDPDDNERININAIRQIESLGEVFITGTRLHEHTYLRTYFGNPARTSEDVVNMAEVIKLAYDTVLSGN